MNNHTRLHTIGHVFAAATLLINAGCAGSSSVPSASSGLPLASLGLPSASSAQQLAQTDVHPVTRHLSLTMVFMDKSSFAVLPTQDNAGQCWQPATVEKPLVPGGEEPFVIGYDFLCGDDPPAYTVVWRKNPAAWPGCEFHVAVEKTKAQNADWLKITTTNNDLTCTAQWQGSNGGAVVKYGFISN